MSTPRKFYMQVHNHLSFLPTFLPFSSPTKPFRCNHNKKLMHGNNKNMQVYDYHLFLHNNQYWNYCFCFQSDFPFAVFLFTARRVNRFNRVVVNGKVHFTPSIVDCRAGYRTPFAEAAVHTTFRARCLTYQTDKYLVRGSYNRSSRSAVLSDLHDRRR